MRLRRAAAVLLLLAATPSRAVAAAEPLTLQAAEALLIERNLAVVAARRGVDAARAQRLVASSLPPAQVNVGQSFAQFGEAQRGGVRGGRYLSPSQNISVGLTVLVERGGKRELRTRVAEGQIAAAEAAVLDTLRTSVFQLRQAFLGALLARANLEVALANRASLDRTETLLRRQVRDGALAEGDLLRFQASRLVFEADVTANAQAYAAGVAAVAALLAEDAAAFRPGAGQVVPPEPGTGEGSAPGPRRLPSAPPPSAVAAAPTTVRTILSPVAFDVRGRLDTHAAPGLVRDALAAGVASRADVVAAARNADAAGQNRLLLEAERNRDVTVSPAWTRSRLSQDLPDGRTRPDAINQFGVSISVPIFTQRIVEGNIGVAAAQLGQAEAQARATLLAARADFAAAWATYEQASALLALYQGGALTRAEEAYRSAELAYLAGGRTLLEVLDALRTLNATRVGANGARRAYLLALAGLEHATGISGIMPRL